MSGFAERIHESTDYFLQTTSLNKHLGELMEGLTAKVFRTFNASKTLQDQLSELTVEDENATGKLLSYNRANRAVAILCNHQVGLFLWILFHISMCLAQDIMFNLIHSC